LSSNNLGFYCSIFLAFGGFVIINGKRISLAKLEEFKKSFIDWAFSHASDQSTGRYEIAQEVWIDKEITIYKLQQELKTVKIELEEALLTMDDLLK
jgi:hypothetical protein